MHTRASKLRIAKDFSHSEQMFLFTKEQFKDMNVSVYVKANIDFRRVIFSNLFLLHLNYTKINSI